MGLSEGNIEIEPWSSNPGLSGVPTKRKMHILKKIKKRFGFARRNSGAHTGLNNLPPLLFHHVHGDNIRLSRDGSIARRYDSFCRAITFSARPVRVNELICVKFTEISNNWNGGIRFGFTSKDPATLENCLPKYASPDLTSRAGFWAKALNEVHCEKDNILFYYVNSAGDVIYGINGEEKEIILSGVDTRGLLWTLIDVYGNCTGIEFLDARIHALKKPKNNNRVHNSNRSITSSSSEIERLVVPSMQSLNINEEIPFIRFNNIGQLHPVQFHITKGHNIRLNQDRLIACRAGNNICQGYVFTASPLRIGEKLVIQILKTDSIFGGALALGLTSCNPSTLQPEDLPDDSDFLLDRPEYWVVSKDIASQPQKGDEISFSININGEVTITKNQLEPVVVMHVDQSLELWAFLDIYGSTQSVRIFKQQLVSASANQLNSQYQHQILNPQFPVISQAPCSSISQQAIQLSPSRRHYTSLPGTDSLNCINAQNLELKNSKRSTSNVSNNLLPTTSVAIQVPTVGPAQLVSVPSKNGDLIQIPNGAVLLVNLPSSADIQPLQLTPNINNQSTKLGQQQSISNCNQNIPSTSATALLSNGNTLQCLENESAHQIPRLKSTDAFQPITQWNDENQSCGSNAECTICYENPIDSVLYMCGHMCMCYECAIEQFRGVGGGRCPLCRAVIRDVIRTYTT